MQRECALEVSNRTPDLLTPTDRVIDLQHIADKTEVEAWKAIKHASDERDITDFKEAVQVLVKACPEITYPKLEKQIRKRDLDVYLIALVSLLHPILASSSLTSSARKEKDHGDTLTSVNLQGELDKKFVVGYYLSEKPQRPSMKERWPKSPEENLKRLEDAGVPMDRCVTKCSNVCGLKLLLDSFTNPTFSATNLVILLELVHKISRILIVRKLAVLCVVLTGKMHSQLDSTETECLQTSCS